MQIFRKRKSENIWIIFIVIFFHLTSVISVADGSQDEKLTLKIGFDLIPRADGNPSVRFRNFEDINLRKFEKKDDQLSTAKRADTSNETEENKEEKPKEDKDSDAEIVAESSDSDDRALRSTKGINPDEFEPERNPRVHNRGKQSDSYTEEND